MGDRRHHGKAGTDLDDRSWASCIPNFVSPLLVPLLSHIHRLFFLDECHRIKWHSYMNSQGKKAMCHEDPG